MAFLVPDSTRNEYGLVINKKILPANLKPNRKLSNGTGKVEYVTVHNTDDINEAKGTNDAEQYARATFNGNMGDVTVHYYVDETGCWQILEEDEVGYHAADGYYGPGNNTSIAIEIVMDGSGSKSDTGAEDRGALLAAIILYRHGLGIDRLTTHNRWYSRKYCPVYILPHWNEFKKSVETYLTFIKSQNEKVDELPTTTPEDDVLHRVQVGAFKSRANAENLVEALNEVGFDAFIVEPTYDEYFRVQVGAFRVREYAEAYMEELKSIGFDAFIVTEKTDTDEDEPAGGVVLLGDVDGDGKVTSYDARSILRAAVGLEEVPLDKGDMNKDGKITSEDARLAMRKAVDLD